MCATVSPKSARDMEIPANASPREYIRLSTGLLFIFFSLKIKEKCENMVFSFHSFYTSVQREESADTHLIE